MNDVAKSLDPWGPISTILYAISDSDFVQNAVANTGVPINWRPMSANESYSHTTRIRALRRDIDTAYNQLNDERKGRFSLIVVKALLARHDGETQRSKLVDRLADIDWSISETGLLMTRDSLLSEQYFPPGSPHDAYVAIRGVLARASKEIVIVDPYIGSTLLATLGTIATGQLSIRVITTAKNLKPDFPVELSVFRKQFPQLAVELRSSGAFHDRFIAIDDAQFYHVGASIKDAGARAFMVSRIEDAENVEGVRQSIARAWTAGTPLFP